MIKKNIYEGNGKIDESKATEFETNIISSEQKEIIELKKKYEELEKAVYSSQKLTDKIAKELI